VFGLPLDIVLAIGSNIMGCATGLIANSQKAKAEQHRMIMERLTFDVERMKIQSELSNSEFELRSKDRFSSVTRRILVIFFVILIAVISLAPMFGTVNIAIPVELKSGGKYLFGLIDTTKTWTEWQIIQDSVMFRENYDTLLIMIFSFYLGSSSVKR
jgi:hypothetical protein